MQIVELHAEDLETAIGFAAALKNVIGAPDWHGEGVDAFLDSMICHDDINKLKAPYTIRIRGADKAGTEAQDMMRLLAQLIDERAASDRGGDLEVRVLFEDSTAG